MAVLAGIDFFTVEVLTWRGLATYYVLFFWQLETRRVTLAGITQHPPEEWMVQMARNAVDDIDGALLRSTLPCMIATRSSAPPSELYFSPAEFTPSCCRPAVRI
jgi:hypothetical protein